MFQAIKNYFKKLESEFNKELEETGVVLLPDGPSFGTFTLPLPVDHWLTKSREYEGNSIASVDFPKQHVLAPRVLYEEKVVEAARWAIRASTDCGRYKDFDPDAMVINLVYALCGPCKNRTVSVADKSVEP